jgi:hypothetical protein
VATHSRYIKTTVGGKEYRGIEPAAKAHGIPSGVLKRLLTKVTAEQSIESLVAAYIESQPNRKNVPIPMVVFGVQYKSLLQVEKAFGMSIKGLKTPSLIEGHILETKSKVLRFKGKTFNSAKELAAFLKNDTITSSGILGAIRRGENVEGWVSRQMRLQRRLLVNDVQYKSANDFADRHEISRARIHVMFSQNEASLEQIARHLGIEVKNKPERSGRVIIKNKVRMSGWEWPSQKAFLFYYYEEAQTRRYYAIKESAQGVAAAIYPRLVDLYRLRKLGPDNRFLPEIEKAMPKWCLPLKQDRLPPINSMDRQCTPDMAILEPGIRHDYESVHDLPEIVKTVWQMESQRTDRDAPVSIHKCGSQTRMET